MNKDEALQFLDDPKRYGSDTDPSLLRDALQRLGSPETGLTIIHLAGTNGKGSTGAYLCSLLESNGETAGHFTSPHVLDFLERIRIGGKNCDPVLFSRAAAFVKETLREMDEFDQFRAFSLQLFTALIVFRNAGVRFVVLEAGIGGRDDATNVFIPRVSALTPVGLDHMPRLGTTVEDIARHKAGIIKPGVPVFSAPQIPAVRRILEDAARVNRAPLIFLQPEQIRIEQSDAQGVRFIWENQLELTTQMGGCYQAENAGLAILIARHLMPYLSDAAIREGIAKASMPGRRQLVARDPLVVVDGAHNRHAIETFCAENAGRKDAIGIVGMMHDKETEEVLSLWKACFSTLYLVPVADARSWDPKRVKDTFFADLAQVTACESLPEALAYAGKQPGKAIYIMGSLYLAGEALTLFAKKR